MIATFSSKGFRVAILLTITAALALGSFWLLEVMRRSVTDSAPAAASNEPDYYVENFNFVKMSLTGEPQYNIVGQRMDHHPADDSHSITKPVVTNLSKERTPMTASSQTAKLDRINSKVHMYKDVQLDRPATPTNEHFHLASEYLLILPDEDIMKTDKPVVITLGNSILKGTGMVANNATGELTLSSNVNATYKPPLQRASQ